MMLLILLIQSFILGRNDSKGRLLSPPEVEASLVILTARTVIDDNGCAIRRPLSFQLFERGWRRMVIHTVCVILLSSTIVDLEVIEMPKRNPRNVFILDGYVNVVTNDLCLVLQRPLCI